MIATAAASAAAVAAAVAAAAASRGHVRARVACVYPVKQMKLAPLLGKINLNRALRRFADVLLAPKHAKAQ